MGKKASIGTSQQLPVPKFIKGLGPNLHIVQIASYEEMHPITRNITYKLVSLPSLVMFQLQSNQAVTCQRSPKFHTNLRWRLPNPYKVSNFYDF